MSADTDVKVSQLEKVTMTLPSELLAAVDDVCRERDQSRSGFVRVALRKALADERGAARE